MANSFDGSRSRGDGSEQAGAFEEESTVSIKPTLHEDDPTDPDLSLEGTMDDPSVPTADLPASQSPVVVLRAMEEVERLKALAGSRGARISAEVVGAIRAALTLPGPARLTPELAVAAAGSLLALTDDQYAHAAEMLQRAGQDADGNVLAHADRAAERALILRAVAERRSKLATGVLSQIIRRVGIPVTSDRNLKEIAAFAEEIRGRKGGD